MHQNAHLWQLDSCRAGRGTGTGWCRAVEATKAEPLCINSSPNPTPTCCQVKTLPDTPLTPYQQSIKTRLEWFNNCPFAHISIYIFNAFPHPPTPPALSLIYSIACKPTATACKEVLIRRQKSYSTFVEYHKRMIKVELSCRAKRLADSD